MRVLKYRKTDKERLGAGRHARKAERVRVGASLLGSSSITFDEWIGASNETMPPCSSAVRALR
jgi:hypothetical protein